MTFNHKETGYNVHTSISNGKPGSRKKSSFLMKRSLNQMILTVCSTTDIIWETKRRSTLEGSVEVLRWIFGARIPTEAQYVWCTLTATLIWNCNTLQNFPFSEADYKFREHWILQKDNSSVHTSNFTKLWLNSFEVDGRHFGLSGKVPGPQYSWEFLGTDATEGLRWWEAIC